MSYRFDTRMFSRRIRLAGGAAIAALALTAGAGAAQAMTIAALQDGSTIILIDAQQRKVTGVVPLANGGRLVGFDVRPADGRLYGVTLEGAIVTVDPRTGQWQKKSQLSEGLPAGATISVDFNPAADRLRILTSTGASLRVNVEDGKATVDGALKYAETDAGKGNAPRVTAASYTNSFAGTKETALYDIDAAAGRLTKQAPPNDGILTTTGALGVKVDGAIGFDIASDGQGGNVGWLLAGGVLHNVDLATGSARVLGPVPGLTGPVGDIAILPGQ